MSCLFGISALCIVSLAYGQTQSVTREYIKSLRQHRVENPAAFFYDFENSPVTINPGSGGSARPLSSLEMPTLAGQGVAMQIVDIEPCGINLPHTHQRATEFLFANNADVADMDVGFVEENGS